MKKKFRPLVIALCCLLVVGVGYALVLALVPDLVEENFVLPDYSTITPYELKTLDRIEFSFDDGYEYTIDLGRDTSANRSFAIAGKEQFHYDESSLSNACLAIASISTSRSYAEDAMESAVYGLDDPRAVIDVYGIDGTSVRILVGDPTRVADFCYVQKEGDDAVYMVSGYTAKYLTNTDHAYRSRVIFSYTDKEYIFSDINAIDISKGDEPFFSYHVGTEEEMEAQPYGLAVSAYMTEPIEYPISQDRLVDRILTNIVSLTANAIVEDEPKDLSKWGLDGDNLLHFVVTNVDGSKIDLTLSEPTEDGLRYGIMAGVNSVYEFDESDFAFLDGFHYKEVLYNLFWSFSITECNAVELTVDGDTHRMEFFDPNTDEKEAGKTFWATFDGEELREENCRTLFAYMLYPKIYDLVPEDYVPAGDPACVLMIETEDGVEHEIELYAINERQFAAYLDGVETGFLVKKDAITNIIDCIDIILEGDLIPAF